MKRLLVFVAVILIPTFVILFYSYESSVGIGSIEPKSFPGWQTTEQAPANCPTQLKGYPFVYQSQQNCQKKFNPIILGADILILAGIICLIGLCANYFKKPLPPGVRQIKLRLMEFKILQFLTGICAIFVVLGALSGAIKLVGLVVLMLSGVIFGGISYSLFSRWKAHDLNQKLEQSFKKSLLFFGGLLAFMVGLFIALIVAHMVNPGIQVQKTFGYLAVLVVFLGFICQVLATIFRDVFKHSKRPKA